MLVPRTELLARIRRTLKASPVTALYSPRQYGKTAMARALAQEGGAEYFDLEDPVSQRRLSEPMTALRPLRGLSGGGAVFHAPTWPEPTRPAATGRRTSSAPSSSAISASTARRCPP